MRNMNRAKRSVVFSMMIAFMAVGMQMPATAGMIDNTQLSTQTELQMQRDEIRSILAREDVRIALLNYGVSDADVDQRINNMTAGELSQVQGELANLPAGAGAGGAVITVLLILILLEVVGAIDIFPRL